MQIISPIVISTEGAETLEQVTQDCENTFKEISGELNQAYLKLKQML